MVYLDGEELLRLHKIVIDYAGGSHGVRDAHLLGSILVKPRTVVDGQEVYSTIWEKAACYMESLAKYHVFVDGNKRTSVAVTVRFLRLNGYQLVATNKSLEQFVIGIIVKKRSVPAIAVWLEKRCKKVT
jgi:death-on-curing protein